MTVGQTALLQAPKLLDDARHRRAAPDRGSAAGARHRLRAHLALRALRPMSCARCGGFTTAAICMSACRASPRSTSPAARSSTAASSASRRDVLIPRPETEHVVEAALHLAPDAHRFWISAPAPAPSRSRCRSNSPTRHVAATDLSEAAVRVAAGNARSLGARVDFAVLRSGLRAVGRGRSIWWSPIRRTCPRARRRRSSARSASTSRSLRSIRRRRRAGNLSPPDPRSRAVAQARRLADYGNRLIGREPAVGAMLGAGWNVHGPGRDARGPGGDSARDRARRRA